MWWAGKARGAPAGGGVFPTTRRAPSPAHLARPLPLAAAVLPPSISLSSAARLPASTSAASPDGSWSGLLGGSGGLGGGGGRGGLGGRLPGEVCSQRSGERPHPRLWRDLSRLRERCSHRR